MAKLSSLLSDTKSIDEGMWQPVNPAFYDDLEIFTRGFTDDFVDAQAARLRKLRLDNDIIEGDPLPNAMQRELNAGLLRDLLVLDVRNLEGDDGIQVSVEDFKAMLDKPNAGRLVRACWEAASRVSSRTTKSTAAALGN